MNIEINIGDLFLEDNAVGYVVKKDNDGWLTILWLGDEDDPDTQFMRGYRNDETQVGEYWETLIRNEAIKHIKR